MSQENGGCDASRSFRYYIRAWLALPITTKELQWVINVDLIKSQTKHLRKTNIWEHSHLMHSYSGGTIY
jgi:hypothetical protein